MYDDMSALGFTVERVVVTKDGITMGRYRIWNIMYFLLMVFECVHI